jgi:P27 family predicted phage terminase small subunit
MGRAKTVELLRDTKPERLLPVCPEWLSEGAKAAWGELVPLVDSDTLLIADTPALALLCCTYAEWRRLSREVEAEGFCYECKTEAGASMQRPNPKTRFLSDASRRLISCLSEFSLTPAARAKNAKPRTSETFISYPYAR